MDIAASLWPTAVEVQLGDWVYEIPELPASVWIRAISDPNGGAIVPGLLEPSDQRLVWRDVSMGRMEPDELADAWRSVVAAASGRPWWEAARLVMSATSRDNWSIIHGKLVQRGVDLDKFSIGGFCNVVQTMALEACADMAERSKFEFDLTTPPPDVKADEAHVSTDAPSDFLAAMGQFQNLGGRAPAQHGDRASTGGPAREVR